MDVLCQLVYEASKQLGGSDIFARQVGVNPWEVCQWIAGRNLPQGRHRTILLQYLSLLKSRPAAQT